MILYISSATSYQIYDALFKEKYINAGYQAQKFNDNLIRGLKEFFAVTALSSLPYENKSHSSIQEKIDGVDYYCVKNKKGVLRRFVRIHELVKEGARIIKEKKPSYIICDSIVSAATYAAVKLGKRYKIPVVAIVTDVPEFMCGGKVGIIGRITARFMKKYDGYILLTEQMNDVVNPKGKPYMVMEGACGEIPALSQIEPNKKIVMYSGSLWKKEAGLEYLTEGFIRANIPNSELHFYGTGEFVEELINISQKHENVKYMGCVTNEEMVRKQTEATLLVNPRPSDAEFCKYSFPSKTFEYMASGTPVLMTKLPGIPEEYFKYVYTIEEETSAGIERLIKNVLSQDENELKRKGLSAREFVKDYKNYRIQSNRIANFLQEYISNREK